MSEPLSAGVVSGEIDRRVAEVVAEITDRLHAGEPVDIAEYMTRHPELADRLRPLLAALDMLAQFSSSGGSDRPTGKSVADEELGRTLGDFRLIREVGRGGMGVVYEAEQLSLRRRVALKALPFAATMDPRHLQRFHNEAQAAACLHHTNIVPVFFVGCERGVHFYAMQFIDGQPLSEFIRQLQQVEKKAPTVEGEVTVAYQPSGIEAASTPLPAAELTPLTGEGRRSRDYFRKVAELGIQAAEALDHAHQLGIVHRDIKPSNLMLDVRGNLWVTDFGLAQVQQREASLTITGDLVGTLRYMSPEQALAKRALIDHRTDIYSLGVTLYELLTLQPAFAGKDRHELLQQIAIEEPAAPRRLNKAIPAELEIIVLKAMEKNPAERYTTAKEVADDLCRFLDGQLIRARRPTLRQRARKWAGRHRYLVGSAAAVLSLAVTMLASSIGWVASDRTARRAQNTQVVTAALEETDSWQRLRRLPEALSAARRADGLLAGADVDEALRQKARARLADLELLERLENVRLEKLTAIKDGHFDWEGADELNEQSFRDAGLEVETLPVDKAVERFQRSTVAAELAAMLDHWAMVRRHARGADDKSWRHLLRVARLADPDAGRTQVREALERRDSQALRTAAASEEVFRLPAATLSVLGYALLEDKELRGQAEAFLRKAQQRYPADFWINFELAGCLYQEPATRADGIEFMRVALALRPHSHAVYNNLGVVLEVRNQLAEAEAAYGKAIELKPDHAETYVNLGNVLMGQKKLADAEAAYRKAIELKPDDAGFYNSLGNGLKGQKKLEEAAYRKAIELKPDYADAHCNLGVALFEQGKLVEAEAAFRKAIELKPDHADAYYSLGIARQVQGQLAEAEAAYCKAIELKPDYAEAHCNLGQVRVLQGRFAEALVNRRRGHELGSQRPGWQYPSAQRVKESERLVELDAKLSRVLKGEVQPADVSERLALAELCQLPCKSLHGAAVRFYADAFAAQPQLADDLQGQHRCNAACAAALAGCGQGKDADKLDWKERARLLHQALDWLRADLKAYRQALDKSAVKAGPEITQRMQHWLQDADFASVRSSESLSKLPDAERRAWQKIWEDVETLRQRAAQQPKTPSATRP